MIHNVAIIISMYIIFIICTGDIMHSLINCVLCPNRTVGENDSIYLFLRSFRKSGIVVVSKIIFNHYPICRIFYGKLQVIVIAPGYSFYANIIRANTFTKLNSVYAAAV